MTNRLGDLLLILRIRILSINITWNFNIYLDNHQGSIFLRTLICLGGFTKRAQIPFSAWLPAAIAAPTPVSSLVHSSTLVTAGIYIIFRFAPILNLEIVRIFGVLTLLIAGLNALKEIDIKKIVALSTLRQLGLIVSGLGLGFTLSAFFHLILHAFFKALLFIRVGNIIHLSDDYQDLRKINFWENKRSITLRFCIISNLRLIGFPAFRGFFSKDFILESNFFNFNIRRYYWILIFLGCIFTSVYSIRFLKNIIFRDNKRKRLLFKFKEDGNFFFGGSCLFIIALRRGGWIFWILFHENIRILFRAELKILINLIIILGRLIYFFIRILTIKFNFINWCVLHIWGLPLFVTKLIKWPIILINKILACHSDQFVNKETLIFIDSYLSYWDIFKTKKLVTRFKFILLIFIFMIF